jgi:MFS family permease
MAVIAASPLSELEHRVQLRRAVIASTVGTTIEWYDFFLYSTVTGLVFAKLYFPRSDPLVGTLEAFAIYAVGFVARPVGAVIFGHYGCSWRIWRHWRSARSLVTSSLRGDGGSRSFSASS